MSNPMNDAIPKAMGAVKDVKAVFKGLSGVFRHLMEEHGKVGALVNRLQNSSEQQLRWDLYPTVRAELLSHERGELVVIYPLLDSLPETEGMARAHSLEAEQLEAAIAAVDALDFSDGAWEAAFARVAELVRAHVDEEESKLFPRAQAALGDERARALLEPYEACKTSARAGLGFSARSGG